MGVVSRRSRSWRRLAVVTVVAFLFAGAIAVTAGRPVHVPAAVLQLHMRRTGSSTLLIRSSTSSTDDTSPASRRRLSGPGSSPPTCRARCGRCTPCRPVRVTIQPGLGTQWEYYPEVWRCKCGNKLYMP